MHYEQAFPSTYIKASDLQGREVAVVIAEAAMENIGEESKLVLRFQGKDRGMVCNKTNAARIADSYGPETDDWIGKEIVLFADRVAFQGRMVDGIRVKPPAPRQPAPAARSKTEFAEREGYTVSTGKPVAAAPAADPFDEEIPF